MSGGKNGPNNSPVVGPTASLLSRQQDYRRKEQWEMRTLGTRWQKAMSASLRGTKTQSLLFGEVILAQTAGQSGGWEVAGPRA